MLAHDLANGIPFLDQEFDVVYHSHVLEHFDRSEGEKFLRECFRVLKPGGIIRVAVPDLERIVREYLAAFEATQRGEKDREPDYEWMGLELYDQTVRDQSGGEMKRFLRGEVRNRKFVIQRLGTEARRLMEPPKKPELIARSLKSRGRFGRKWRDKILRLLLGSEYEALVVGRFRRSGEIHRCMYDTYSLTQALALAGFLDVTRRNAAESFLRDWPQWNLDTEPDGSVYKPDSLFMEARKA